MNGANAQPSRETVEPPSGTRTPTAPITSLKSPHSALTHSMYRENARYFQKSLAENSGLSVAAELLENAFGLTKARDNSAK